MELREGWEIDRDARAEGLQVKERTDDVAMIEHDGIFMQSSFYQDKQMSRHEIFKHAISKVLRLASQDYDTFASILRSFDHLKDGMIVNYDFLKVLDVMHVGLTPDEKRILSREFSDGSDRVNMLHFVDALGGEAALQISTTKHALQNKNERVRKSRQDKTKLAGCFSMFRSSRPQDTKKERRR
mmetsp:Transcript_2105/g.6419  ORF Transcript_2105/g.6419 Transcript_2105/m.6419 type:complete len:184 (-) Transcript_2105:1613-2164(-)